MGNNQWVIDSTVPQRCWVHFIIAIAVTGPMRQPDDSTTAGASARAMNSRRVSRLRMFRTRSARGAWLGAAHDAAGQRADHGRSARVVAGSSFTGLSSDCVCIISASVQTAQAWNQLGFHDLHLDIFNSNPFTFSPIPGQVSAMDRFSQSSVSQARAMNLKLGILPHRTLYHGLRITF